VTTVRDIADELALPISWVIKILMGHGPIQSATRELTAEEVAMVRAGAERLEHSR
jgi:hypothetical protein